MKAVSFRHWQVRQSELSPSAIERLAGELQLAPLTARVLAQRGLGSAEAGRGFLRSSLASLPDPFLLPGMDRAVARLAAAVEAGERIAVHGDYDVDGITGTALLVETLRLLGAEVESHIPLRLKDGYGLSAEALQKAAAGGARVALSVDCGVSAVAEAQLARELGLDLIITDHHQPPDPLPAALAIVNPHLPENRFPFQELAGVGVAFFLLVGLRKTLRERGFFATRPEPDLRCSLDLVALGTIADVVPLQGVNRILVRVGLTSMNRSDRPGLQALKEVAAVSEVNCGNVAFRLAPRLNAAGRLEDALLGVELLLESSPERCLAMARLLDDFNRERQAIEQETLRQAVTRLEAKPGEGQRSIVLADPALASGSDRHRRQSARRALPPAGGAHRPGKRAGQGLRPLDCRFSPLSVSAELPSPSGRLRRPRLRGRPDDCENEVEAFAAAFEEWRGRASARPTCSRRCCTMAKYCWRN
jgi:single-stranded-DNA-specific exonuclease